MRKIPLLSDSPLGMRCVGARAVLPATHGPRRHLAVRPTNRGLLPWSHLTGIQRQLTVGKLERSTRGVLK